MKTIVASKKGKRKMKNKNVKETLKKKAENEKGVCCPCGKKGHWKRNCRKYFSEIAQKKHDDDSKIDK